MPPPAGWWDDDPVEWARHAISGSLGSDHQGRLTDEELSALAEMERGNRATWSSVLRRTAAGGVADFSRLLPQVAVPTSIVHGDADALVATDRAVTLAEGIPDARLVMLPGAGHLPWLEQPGEGIGTILNFLGETGQRIQ